MDIKIIGLGGIGSILSNTISRYINTNEAFAGSSICLVDGDEYEVKNSERQEFEMFGVKSRSKYQELIHKFHNIEYDVVPFFVNEDNISNIIQENSIVFVCVDNHKTRRLISDYGKTLNDIVIISGGNELTDGNVQIFIRQGGFDVTPSLTDYHPDIRNSEDKSPEEMSCEELSKSQPQLYFTNFMVASYMCAAFYNVIIKRNYAYSEIYFDLLTMNASSKIRAVKTNKK